MAEQNDDWEEIVVFWKGSPIPIEYVGGFYRLKGIDTLFMSRGQAEEFYKAKETDKMYALTHKDLRKARIKDPKERSKIYHQREKEWQEWLDK